ncbi:MAG: AmmeMemoRadiSam system radical SAM enzyme [Deltaproteobacteria bacterium]|nr:AmmeMemoRadiSam system radical SAM enzyme [Deltaproteobacteria bacterium]
MKSGSYFKKTGGEVIICTLCPHNCRLFHEGKKITGKCGTRKGHNGSIEILNYGRISAASIDPVEKKPLFHFKPGTKTFSIATNGCNMICPFCQNSSLSQTPLSGDFKFSNVSLCSPKEVVDKALDNNCESISFTYSEPVLSLEFALETAYFAQKESIDIIFVTNGQINPRPLLDLAGVLNAANVDLKSFSDKTYKNILGGNLAAAINTIEILYKHGVIVEISTLIVPGLNDTDDEIFKMADFIAQLDKEIPWHILRFFPSYKYLNYKGTSVKSMEKALQIADDAGLKHVYCGNVPLTKYENTVCSQCGNIIIRRSGYNIFETALDNGKCSFCGYKLYGSGF